MKVIVAGHQKTGTKTLNEALTILGYNVYDFIENYYYLHKEWKTILNEGGNDELFQKMYKDVDAVCDLPCLVFWEEIHKAFPDAKIILSMRENEDEWYRSINKQLSSNQGYYLLRLIFLLSPTAIMRFVKLGSQIASIAYGIPPNKLFTNRMNETLAKLSYRRHNAHVLKNAPPDKLLVYNCKEGWEPLCKFLDVDVPDVPFPHRNKSGSIFHDLMKSNDVLKHMKREAIVVSSSIFVCIGIGAYACSKYFSFF